MRIVVDAMGGDHAPSAAVAGVVQAARDGLGEFVLVGPADVVNGELHRQAAGGLPIAVVDAPEIIASDDEPVRAIQRKKRSSMGVGMGLVRDKSADAFVSAGNTGALMAGGLFILGRIPGVKRPAISGVLPTLDGEGCLVLDLGAHMDATAVNLYQYAVMGSVYAEKVRGVVRPRVGLLNVGTEENKGNDVVREAFQMLRACSLNFIGNVEGRDIFSHTADVVVCDGFVGNVMLKALEGLGQGFFTLLKRELTADWRAKAGALIAAHALRRLARVVDYREYGGAPILGVDGVCIKCHGSSDARAIRKGIEVARQVAEQRVIDIIKGELAAGEQAGVAGPTAVGGEDA